MLADPSQYECVPMDAKSGEREAQFVSPRFSVQTFFLIIAAYSLISAASFYALNNHYARVERLWWRLRREEAPTPKSAIATDSRQQTPSEASLLTSRSRRASSSWRRDFFLLANLAAIGAQVNTIIPAIQSYVALPFSQSFYFWSLVLSAAAQPVGALLSLLYVPRQRAALLVFAVACVAATSYLVVIAAQSPRPWLVGSAAGGYLTVSNGARIFWLRDVHVADCARDRRLYGRNAAANGAQRRVCIRRRKRRTAARAAPLHRGFCIAGKRARARRGRERSATLAFLVWHFRGRLDIFCAHKYWRFICRRSAMLKAA